MLNSYVPPPPPAEEAYHLDTPEEFYDLNCCFTIPSSLSNPNGVLLTPLIPSLHARPLFESSLSSPSLWTQLPVPQPITLPAFLTFLEYFRSNPSSTLFIIHDLSYSSKHSPPIAGIIGLIKSSQQTRSTEIGPIIILPEFQRTHVLTHSAGLVLKWLFEDLRLRRVQWSANELNQGSVRAGERMGLKVEAKMRWERVLPEGKEGVEVPEWAREEEKKEGRGEWSGRHTWLLALGWDDWKKEGKEKVRKLMEREVVMKG